MLSLGWVSVYTSRISRNSYMLLIPPCIHGYTYTVYIYIYIGGGNAPTNLYTLFEAGFQAFGHDRTAQIDVSRDARATESDIVLGHRASGRTPSSAEHVGGKNPQVPQQKLL